MLAQRLRGICNRRTVTINLDKSYLDKEWIGFRPPLAIKLEAQKVPVPKPRSQISANLTEEERKWEERVRNAEGGRAAAAYNEEDEE
jgi:hypothetical protein